MAGQTKIDAFAEGKGGRISMRSAGAGRYRVAACGWAASQRQYSAGLYRRDEQRFGRAIIQQRQVGCTFLLHYAALPQVEYGSFECLDADEAPLAAASAWIRCRRSPLNVVEERSLPGFSAPAFDPVEQVTHARHHVVTVLAYPVCPGGGDRLAQCIVGEIAAQLCDQACCVLEVVRLHAGRIHRCQIVRILRQ